MASIDRPFSIVPRCLPLWMNGPLIERKAEEWEVSYEEARERLREKPIKGLIQEPKGRGRTG